MNIYLKTAVIIITTLVALLGAVYFGARYLILDSFNHLETQQVEQNLGRIDEALKRELKLMQVMTADWSKWDDSYNYMHGFSSEYEESNISVSTIVSLDVSVIAYLDTEFEVQKSFGLDQSSEKLVQLPLSFTEALSDYHRQRPSTETFAGLINIDGNIYMISSDQIVKSDLSGPSRGQLVMMRQFSQKAIKKLAGQTLLNLDFVSLETLKKSPKLADPEQNQTNSHHWVAITGDNQITGIGRVDDINGEPITFAKIESPRVIMRQGLTTLDNFTIMLALAGLLFATIVMWTLRKVILVRLFRLSQNLIEIGNDSHSGRLVEVDGHDEIAVVARASNQMLAGLERFYLQRQHDHDRQRRQNDLLIDLAKAACISAGELSQASQKITEAMLQGCNIDRASIWLSSEDMSHFNCADYLEKSTMNHSQGPSLPSDDTRRMIEKLDQVGMLNIENTALSVDVRALINLLHPQDIDGSMLLLSIKYKGRGHGFVVVESSRINHQYQLNEEIFLLSITEFVEQTIAAQERKQLEQALWRKASYDHLTEIPNRSYFYICLADAITQAKYKNHLMALLFIDLDKFKSVNDDYSHATGDQLLRQVAERIGMVIRDDDIVGRLGGDEFVVLLTKIRHQGDALIVADKLVKNIAKPFLVDAFQLQIGCSIGIALFPQHAETPDELVSLADRAMYQAKEKGRGGFVLHPEGNLSDKTP